MSDVILELHADSITRATVTVENAPSTHETPQPAFGPVFTGVTLSPVKVESIEWYLPDPPPPGVKRLYGRTEQIVGIAYKPGVSGRLELGLTAATAFPTAQSLEIRLHGKTESASKVLDLSRTNGQWDQRGRILYVDVPHDELRELFEDSGCRVNKTFVSVSIHGPVTATGQAIHSRVSLAFPVLQHDLFFLPGVLGSHIWVKDHTGAEVECFPDIDADTETLELLVNRMDGTPYRPAEKAKMKILGLVYKACDRIDDQNKELPELYLDEPKEQRLIFFILKKVEVPYDWRLSMDTRGLPAEATAHELAYPFLATVARTIAERHRSNRKDPSSHPFLADKSALAGHSTGGVLMRGLLSLDTPARGLFGKAFFINVPFWGAPKAEYLFFTGDMGLDWRAALMVSNKERFRLLAPDLLIVYVLCASRWYGAQVGEDWHRDDRKQRFEQAKQLGAYKAQRRPLYGDEWRWHEQNEGLLAFNGTLAEKADDYCTSCEDAGPPSVDAYIFHSIIDQDEGTIVGVRLPSSQEGQIERRTATIGDGTVPTVSQIADVGNWPKAKVMRPTPGNPSHVDAANDEWVWQRVAEVLCGVEPRPEHQGGAEKLLDGKETFCLRWPPTPPQGSPQPDTRTQLNNLLIRLARELAEKSGKYWVNGRNNAGLDPSQERLSLSSGGQPKSFLHEDVDASVFRVTCDSGSIRVVTNVYNAAFEFTQPWMPPKTLTEGQSWISGITVAPPTRGDTRWLGDHDCSLRIECVSGTADCTIEFISWDR